MIVIFSDQGFLKSHVKERWCEETRQMIQAEATWTVFIREALIFESMNKVKPVKARVGGFVWNLKTQKHSSKKWRISLSQESGKQYSTWKVFRCSHPINSDLDWFTERNMVDESCYFEKERAAVEAASRRNQILLQHIRADNEEMTRKLAQSEARSLGII